MHIAEEDDAAAASSSETVSTTVAPGGAGGPVEIVFSFDTTGSMYPCLTQVCYVTYTTQHKHVFMSFIPLTVHKRVYNSHSISMQSVALHCGNKTVQ